MMNNDQLLQLIAAMNPELAPIISMMTQTGNDLTGNPKPKRKASAYNRRYAAAYRRIKKSKTLKSGRMAKGFGGKTGHKKIMALAHKEARKHGRRRK